MHSLMLRRTGTLLLWFLAGITFVLGSSPGMALDGNPGYLGVYVGVSRSGLPIVGFIPDTPAAALASAGVLRRGDVILRLGATNVSTVEELRRARALIPDGKEAKMVLRNNQGELYHVWVSKGKERPSALPEPGGTSVLPGGPADRTTSSDAIDLPSAAPGLSDNISPLPGSSLARPSAPGVSSLAPGGIAPAPGGNRQDGGGDAARKPPGSVGDRRPGTPDRTNNPLLRQLPAGAPDFLNKGDKGVGGKEEFRERIVSQPVRAP